MLNIHETNGHTRLITLIGNPTGHSLSPAIHNLSFQLLGIDAEYRAFDVDNEALGEIVDELRAADRWDGGNVTMPCKQAIIEYLDGLDEAADLIGAVNVLKKTDGKVVGTYALVEEQTIPIDTKYGHNQLVIKEGEAYMDESDCPDHYCEDQGKVSKTGETIVCLPHKLVVEVITGEASDIDVLAK